MTWISIDDALPRVGKRVLIINEYNEYEVAVFTGKSEYPFTTDYADCAEEYVKAWMNFPEYKEEE